MPSGGGSLYRLAVFRYDRTSAPLTIGQLMSKVRGRYSSVVKEID